MTKMTESQEVFLKQLRRTIDAAIEQQQWDEVAHWAGVLVHAAFTYHNEVENG